MKISQHILRILQESRKDEFLKMLPPVDPEKADDPKTQRDYEMVRGRFEYTVKDAVQVLKKTDRIIWYLRYILFLYLAEIEVGRIGLPYVAAVFSQKHRDRYLRKLENKGWNLAAMADEELYSSAQMLGALTHFLSLPIHAIQEYTFEWQTPNEVLSTFRTWEDQWRAEREGFIPLSKIPEEVETLIDFGDGFVLHDLKVNGCRQEADAMGHCSTGARRGDLNWSLRQYREKEGAKGYISHVTMIWNQNDHMVTEIKGRENKIPDRSLWPYLLEALLLDRVKGHKWPYNRREGYLPEHDFRVTLFPAEKVQEIADQKPSIVSPVGLLEKFGLVDWVIEFLNNETRLAWPLLKTSESKSNWSEYYSTVHTEPMTVDDISDHFGSHDWVNYIRPYIQLYVGDLSVLKTLKDRTAQDQNVTSKLMSDERTKLYKLLEEKIQKYDILPDDKYRMLSLPSRLQDAFGVFIFPLVLQTKLERGEYKPEVRDEVFQKYSYLLLEDGTLQRPINLEELVDYYKKEKQDYKSSSEILFGPYSEEGRSFYPLDLRANFDEAGMDRLYELVLENEEELDQIFRIGGLP